MRIPGWWPVTLNATFSTEQESFVGRWRFWNFGIQWLKCSVNSPENAMSPSSWVQPGHFEQWGSHQASYCSFGYHRAIFCMVVGLDLKRLSISEGLIKYCSFGYHQTIFCIYGCGFRFEKTFNQWGSHQGSYCSLGYQQAIFCMDLGFSSFVPLLSLFLGSYGSSPLWVLLQVGPFVPGFWGFVLFALRIYTMESRKLVTVGNWLT